MNLKREKYARFTLDFNLLLKSECLFVTSECSLQSFEIRFELKSRVTPYEVLDRILYNTKIRNFHQ